MKVKNSLQVYQTQIIAMMKMYHKFNLPGFENIEKKVIFMEHVHKFLNLNCVSNTTLNIKKSLNYKAEHLS